MCVLRFQLLDKELILGDKLIIDVLVIFKKGNLKAIDLLLHETDLAVFDKGLPLLLLGDFLVFAELNYLNFLLVKLQLLLLHLVHHLLDYFLVNSLLNLYSIDFGPVLQL